MSLFKLFGAGKPRTAAQRKSDTKNRLVKLGVPVNQHLPLVEDCTSVEIRDSKDVVRRLVILSILHDCVHGFDDLTKESTIEFFKSRELWEYVSGNEKEYLLSAEADEQAEIKISWSAESMKVFFWAVGLIENLDLPLNAANLAAAHKASLEKYKSIPDFVQNAKLRDKEEILNETDFIYRVHWAVKQSMRLGKHAPANLNPDIVYERHYAFNWLTCYAGDWDEITCDT